MKGGAKQRRMYVVRAGRVWSLTLHELIGFLGAGVDDPDIDISRFATPIAKSCAIRKTDDGRTWVPKHFAEEYLIETSTWTQDEFSRELRAVKNEETELSIGRKTLRKKVA